MSKKSKEKKKIERARIKAAKKSANYLKCGPKAGHLGRRQKNRVRKLFKPGPPRSELYVQDFPGSKTRAKRRRKSPLKKTSFLPFLPSTLSGQHIWACAE